MRAESYIHLKDTVRREDVDASEMGQMVILPSSFHGGSRYMHERAQNGMTYVREHGRPDLFITMTCDPKNDDILSVLEPGQKIQDRNDIISRVFQLQVKKLLKLLTKGQIFGKVKCWMYTIEWQKRGLHHVHTLIWLEERITLNLIDKVVCAEIPDPNQDPILFNIITTKMIHGPCGNLNPVSPCMKEDRCSKKFPNQFVKETQTGNDGYPKYRRRCPEDGGFTTETNGKTIDNRWVVPYNKVLSKTFKTHVNVEICHSVKSIKYICAYINKVSDQAAFTIENNKDEVAKYEAGRYICSSEAVWRILKFPIHDRYPYILHLAVHLENRQRVYFDPSNLYTKVNYPPPTTVLAFFNLCKIDNFAKTLIYPQVNSYFTWGSNMFKRRKVGRDVQEWPGVKMMTH